MPPSASNPRPAIPVHQPDLRADEILPYPERIDRSRRYSNWGPMVSRRQRRRRAAAG